jgi:hypothetical protein
MKLRIAELEQAIAAGSDSESDLEQARQSLRALLAAGDPTAAVIVRGRVHPGVTVAIRDVRRTVAEACGRCRIGLAENREVQISPFI